MTTQSSKPPTGRRMKAHAPAPPQVPQPAPRHIFRNSLPDGGWTSTTDSKENLLRATVDFQLTLPQGKHFSVTEDGSKALMDLLVELCSRHHLNPALHTLELLSPEGHPLGFKPNALLGSLNVACILIREKLLEEKARRPAPKVPEKTVRLMVNYHGSQKAVVRVNPLVPLRALIPVICDKCEFDPERILLLKDSSSQHELAPEKSLTELEIKELYVHDLSLASQPKMASAPALNYSGTISSSTASLGRPQKKGFRGIFQFSNRKSKTEASVDMDDCDDRIDQNSDIHINGLSTMSAIHSTEDRPATLGQSQSVVDIPRMSSKTEPKKRRAPAPPGALTPGRGQTSFEISQVSLGSESQQRKRKAPAPPPTPTSITQDSDDTYTLASHTTDDPTETPTPVCRTKVPQSTTVPNPSVTVQIVKPSPCTVVQPPSVCHPAPCTPSPSSSSTTDSLAVQDSSSELSHSFEDSDADLEPAGSRNSTSSLGSSSVQVRLTTTSTSSRMVESTSSTPAQTNQDVSSDSSSKLDSASSLNLKLEEVENNRHSAIALLHSVQNSKTSGQKQENEAIEAQTESLDWSGSDNSLSGHGYTSPKTITEGKDPGPSSETQPITPGETLFLDGKTGYEGEKPQKKNTSDSDEGCVTWGLIPRCDVTSPQLQSHRNHDDDSQPHQTGIGFKVDVAGKESLYAISTNGNEVPVSVLDMDVPVTAIDEVLMEYENDVFENEVKLSPGTEATGSEGSSFCHNSNVKSQNKNNNAYTAALSDKRHIVKAKQSYQSEQHGKSLEDKSKGGQTEVKIQEVKMKEISLEDTNSTNEEKQTLTVKPNAELQRNSKNSEIIADPNKGKTQSFQLKKPDLPPAVRRSASTGNDDEMLRGHPGNSSFNSKCGKITPNVTSRFGMRTFTVVPPKPSVMHDGKSQPAITVTPGAIKIDDQGNMVKAGHVGKQSSKSEINNASPLHEKAKAFWSSNEKHRSIETPIKNPVDKIKDGAKAVHSSVSTSAEIVELKVVGAEERAEKFAKITDRKCADMESEISMPKNVQRLSDKSAVGPPLLPDLKRDLSFLKPSRRTSSHYVASAISKYAPKTKPSIKPKTLEFPSSTVTDSGFQRIDRSIHVTSAQSPPSFLVNNKENVSTTTPKPPGPKRSLSYPEYVSEEIKIDKKSFEDCVVSTKEDPNMLGAQAANNNHHQSNGSSQIRLYANNGRDLTNHIRPRSPSPAANSPRHSFTKPPTKISSQSQISASKEVAKVTDRPIPKDKPQLLVQVPQTDATSGPPPVMVFGPIQKFKPVIQRSIDKDTSLHSCLMEAILTGGGKERLRKISNSGPSNLTKVTYIEEENERSALLAAIRAQSNTGRLKKTKSEAANELEQFRKTEERIVDSTSPPSLTCSSPAFVPPPPPPMLAPPPPPTVSLLRKPSALARSNAPAMDPALAREAMLEAIRSGSAAERLKKISVPTKTVQVNGRLGTIQATSSAGIRR